MKKVIALILGLLLLIGLVVFVCACDFVIISLGRYSNREIYTHGEYQDFTDYGKYTFEDPKLAKNRYFSRVDASAKNELVKYIDDYEKWVSVLAENEPACELAAHYDFDRSCIDDSDWYYIDADGFHCYDLYFYDVESKVLYWFHNNI